MRTAKRPGSGKRRRIAAALVLGGLVLATGWGLWTIRPILAPFLLAVVIAYLISPLVGALCRLGLSRAWAILAVYGLLTLLGALGVWKVLPQVLAETRRLSESIPLYSNRARELVDGLQQQVHALGLPPELRDVIERNITEMEVWSVAALDRLLGVSSITRAAGFLASAVLAPFLAFYLLRDIEQFKERFVRALPRRYRGEILSLLRALDRVLAGFVRGQLLLALAVGTLAALAATVLGLRYSLLLGIWAGLTELVPYVGPVLGALPAVLGALTFSPFKALQVVLAFAVIQQVENAVLSPKILGESVGLHPLVVMFSILAGGYLFGPWGLILALPVVGVIRVLWCFLLARLTEAALPVEPAVPAARPEPAGEVPQPEPNS